MVYNYVFDLVAIGISVVLAVAIGVIAMLRHSEVRTQLGPNMALMLISLFYAAIWRAPRGQMVRSGRYEKRYRCKTRGSHGYHSPLEP
jgi:energy-coupling factor transporter transmembrane protein EcfT